MDLWRGWNWIWTLLSLVLCVQMVQSQTEKRFVEWEELEKAENEESPFRLRHLLKRYAFATHRKKPSMSEFNMEGHVRHRKILDFQKADVTKGSFPGNGESIQTEVREKRETMIEPGGNGEAAMHDGVSGQSQHASKLGRSGGVRGLDILVDGSGEISPLGEERSGSSNNVNVDTDSYAINPESSVLNVLGDFNTMGDRGRKAATHDTVPAVSSTVNTPNEAAKDDSFTSTLVMNAAPVSKHLAESSLHGDLASSNDYKELIDSESTQQTDVLIASTHHNNAPDGRDITTLSRRNQIVQENNKIFPTHESMQTTGSAYRMVVDTSIGAFPKDDQSISNTEFIKGNDKITSNNHETSPPIFHKSSPRRLIDEISLQTKGKRPPHHDTTTENNQIEEKSIDAKKTKSIVILSAVTGKLPGSHQTNKNHVNLLMPTKSKPTTVDRYPKESQKQAARNIDHKVPRTPRTSTRHNSHAFNEKTTKTKYDSFNPLPSMPFQNGSTGKVNEPKPDTKITQHVAQSSTLEDLDNKPSQYSAPTLRGLSETYPTVTENSPLITAVFTSSGEFASETKRPRVRRTPKSFSTQRKPVVTNNSGYNTYDSNSREHTQSTHIKTVTNNGWVFNTHDSNGGSEHTPNEVTKVDKDENSSIDYKGIATNHNDKTTPDYVSTVTTTDIPGFEEFCGRVNKECGEGLECSQGKCRCPHGQTWSVSRTSCKPDEYWTKLEWEIDSDPESKTVSVNWNFASREAKEDVDKYKVKYWTSGSSTRVDTVDQPHYTFRNLTLMAPYDATVTMMLRGGRTLTSTTDKKIKLCYETELQDIKVNSKKDFDYLEIEYSQTAGCFKTISAEFKDMNHPNPLMVSGSIEKNYQCPSKRTPKTLFLTKTNMTGILRKGSSYNVTITQEPACTPGHHKYYNTRLDTYPQKPTGLKADVEGPTYLTVSWNPPTEGAVDAYRVEASLKGRNTIKFKSSLLMDGRYGCNITGLQKGKQYRVTVKAIYKSNEMEESETFDTVKNVPFKPKSVRLEQNTLRWTIENRQFRKADQFDIQYKCSKTCKAGCKKTEPNTRRRTQGDVSLTLTLDVQDGECCQVSVSGVNGMGHSKMGKVTREPVVVANTWALYDPRIEHNPNEKRARVTVEMTPYTQRGSIYMLEMTVSEKNREIFHSEELHCEGLDCVFPCGYQEPTEGEKFNPEQKSFTFSFPVRPGTEYSISIQPKMATTVTVQPRKRGWKSPDAPPTSPVQEFKLVWKRMDSAQLSWKPPLEKNGEGIKYNISLEFYKQNCSHIPTSDLYYFPVREFHPRSDHQTNEYQLERLLPFTNYIVTVVAANNAGQGTNWSRPITFTTDPKPMDAEFRNVKSVVGSRDVQISWAPPCPLTEPLNSYNVTVSPTNRSSPTHHTTNSSMVIKHLQPVTEYTIRILGIGTRISSEITIQTKVDVPGPVDEMTLTQEEKLDKHRRLIVSWSTPKRPNGNIIGFIVTIEDECSQKVESTHKRSIDTSLSIPATPECFYSVKVTAKTEAGEGEAVRDRIFIKAGVPPKPKETELTPLVHRAKKCNKDDAQRTVPLNLPTEFLCDSTFGRITKRGLLVINQNKQKDISDPKILLRANEVYAMPEAGRGHMEPQRLIQRNPPADAHHQDIADHDRGLARKPKNPIRKLQQDPAQKHPTNGPDPTSNAASPAQVHPHPGVQAIRDQFWHIVLISPTDVMCGHQKPTQDTECGQDTPNGALRFVVGKNPKCHKRGCNRILNAGTEYRFKAFVCTTAGCTTSLKSRVINTEAGKSDKSGLIIGVVVAIIIIVICIFLSYLGYKNRTWIQKRVQGRVTNVPTEPTDGVEMIAAPIPTKPIPLAGLVEHVKEMHRNSDLMFGDEYKLITELSPKCYTTIAEAHRSKNRYSNVLPFDHARVKLLPLEDIDDTSDYINASYIPGLKGPRDYIAAQGPLRTTVDDFWRMIWEQRANAIVMLTQCKEKGKVKCEEYWPTTSQYYGDLEVTLKSESNLPDYVIRVMDLKLGSSQRTVHQFHFLKWPDFGSPDSTYLLPNLVQAVKDHTPYNPNGPIIVHCSAGVGRSGTFIALDILLEQLKSPDCGEVDIFSLVMNMRNNRPLMVQRENQYVHIHDCLRDYILDVSDGENSFNNDEPIYQNT